MATIFLTVTCRKPTNYIFDCLQSVYAQTHKDWILHVTIDDAKTADPDILTRLFQQGTHRNVIIRACPDRRYALRNQLDAVDACCPHDAVVGKLDGDDMLTGTDALSLVSKEYDNDPTLDVLWTKFKSSDNRPCCCREIPEGVDPLTFGWSSSHFQTFRKRLLWGLRREVFIDPELGSEWRCSCDHALYLPLLVHARRRKFLNQVCYFYRRGSGDNKSDEQKRTAKRIREHNIALHTFDKPKNVLFIVNGAAKDSDGRFFNGERRPPLGVLSMSSHLRARGHNVLLVDRFMDPKWTPKSDTIEWADMVGVYVSTPNAGDARDMIKHVRSCNYKGLIAAGGPHSILWPDQVRGWGADLVYPGEADFAISYLVEHGKLPEPMYPKRIERLDQLPFPDYDLLQSQGILDKYSHSWPFTSAQRNVRTLNTSRGCPHGCEFCDVKTVWGRQYHAMSAQRVILDVKELISRYNAEAIYFREDNFCCQPRRLREICAEMPMVVWACEMRADLGADEEIVALMAKAGCRGFYIGAESGSDRVLKLMNKGVTAEQIAKTCHNAKKHGIQVALSMISGFPGETAEDRGITRKFLQSIPHRHAWNGKYRKPWGQYDASPVGD